MSEFLPERLNPIAGAAVKMLRRLSGHWSPIDFDDFTEAEMDAWNRMLESGCAWSRITFIISRKGTPGELRVHAAICGDYRKLLDEKIREWVGTVPNWQIGQGQFVVDRVPTSGRLSILGTGFQEDVNGGSGAGWMSFQMTTGVIDPPVSPKLAPGRVEVESVERIDTAAAAPGGPIIAAAQANASIGDVHVHNHITIDPSAAKPASNGRANKGGKGRPSGTLNSDPVADGKIAERYRAAQEAHKTTIAEFAESMRMTEREVKQAIDRHKSRQKPRRN